MTKTYKVTYTDWKGRPQVAYLYANSREEALESAKVMQGLEYLISIEEGHTSSAYQPFWEASMWKGNEDEK